MGGRLRGTREHGKNGFELVNGEKMERTENVLAIKRKKMGK